MTEVYVADGLLVIFEADSKHTIRISDITTISAYDSGRVSIYANGIERVVIVEDSKKRNELLFIIEDKEI